MKKLTLWLTAFVIAGTALFAIAAQSPFPPWIDKYLSFPPPRAAVNAARRATAVYDVAVDGGSTAAHGLKVYLPASTVIVRSYYVIIKPFTTASGNPTLALSCEDANNIKSAATVSTQGANTFVEGQSTGAASAFVQSIGAACEITATPASSAFTAGKLKVYVDYVTEEAQ